MQLTGAVTMVGGAEPKVPTAMQLTRAVTMVGGTEPNVPTAMQLTGTEPKEPLAM